MAEEHNELTRDQLTKVFGDSGTTRYSGYFQEEPNTQWRDESRVDLVEEMRRTDGAVAAVLSALKTPIVSAEWSIFSYDDSPKGEQIRKDVEDNFFNIERGWREFVRESLGYLDFGHYAFELIWELKNGRIHLKDLAPRIPASIQSWQITGGKRGIKQFIRTDESDKFEAEIPEEKLLILTNNKEGDDVTGQSVLRAAYKHYKYKDVLYRISGVAADRYGVGIPHVELPAEGYGDADKEKIEEALENLRSNEKSYLLTPPGYKVQILTPNGNPQGAQIDTLIDHHNRMIFVSILAQFLMLGSDGTGSMALSGDHSSFFLNHIEDKAKYFASQVNTQAIKRFVDLNYGEQEWYPELRHAPLGSKDVKALAETLSILNMAGLLDPDTDLKKWARQIVDAPELTDEQIAEQEEKEEEMPEMPAQVEEEPEEKEESLSTHFFAEQPLRITRKLTEQEQRVDFKKLNEDFNDLETQLEDELAEATAAEIDRYAEAVQKKIDAGDIAGIAALSIMALGKTRSALDRAIKGGYEVGKKSAALEIGIDRPSTPLKDTQIMAMDVNDLARAFVFSLEQRMRNLVKDSIASDASAGATAAAVKSRAKDEASKLITNMSGTVVGQYTNRGRSTVFQSNITKIVGFQRSEVLDNSTCDMCLSLDQRVIKASDPMAQLDIVHTHCRGLWVPIFEIDETIPEVTGLPKSVTDSFETIDGRPSVNAFKQLKKPVNKDNQEVQKIIRRKMGV